MKKQINDWRPVIASFLKYLTDQDPGVTISAVDDGGEEEEKIDQTLSIDAQIAAAAEIVNGVDHANIFVRIPGEKKRHMLMVVLGNGPEEIVADHSDHIYIDRAWDAHSQEWTDKPVPQRDSPY